MSKKLANALVSLLQRFRVLDSVRRRMGGLGVILAFHEIHDDVTSQLMTGCSARFLRNALCELRSNGWELVSLDDALSRVAHQSKVPFAVLTFDDGYRDSLTRALPILEALQAPFTIYVPTHAVTRELYPWWLALRELFRSQREVTLDCMDCTFSCVDLTSKIAALNRARRWVRQNYERRFELKKAFHRYCISIESLVDTYFLNSEELRVLARNPLVTIGAHTTSHAILSALASEEVRREIADNRTFLQDLLKKDVIHLAYPYGDRRSCGEREAIIARDLGFCSAVTAEASPVFVMHRYLPHRMPRIGIRPHDTLATLYYRASGLSWALNFGKRT